MRTLPIRVAPIDGEALDSWLEALAHRNQTCFGDVLTAVGLGAYGVDRRTSAWSVSLTPHEAAAITTITGVQLSSLKAMTLDHYAERAVRLNPDTRALSRAFPWCRARGSRFCPTCLKETSGRWQLRWRLGWTFACIKHHCLLADACPQCGAVPRLRPHVTEIVPRPSHCAHPAPNATGRASARCDGPLLATTVTTFDPDHPVMNAQRTVNSILDTTTPDFGVYAIEPVTRTQALSDIRALAGRALAYATPEDLERRIPGDLLTAYRREPRRRPRGSGPARPTTKPGLAAPALAATAAAGVIIALQTLDQADITAASASLRWLISSGRDRGLSVRATNIGWGKGTSSILTGVQLNALGPALSPADHLRYRIGTASPAHPGPATTPSAKLARRLPTMLWPAWSLRFAIPNCRHRQLQSALSVAVLFVGTRLTSAQATSLINSALDGAAVTRVLQLIRKHHAWNTIREAIIDIHDHIGEYEPPIDYQRRRQIDFTYLLPNSIWEEIRSSTNTPELEVGKARGFLYEQLTGSPVLKAAEALSDSLFHREAYNFPKYLTAELKSTLDEYARTFLADNRIDDEPTIWQPPTEVLDRFELPGPAPAAVDVQGLRSTLPTYARKIGAAADHHGISCDVLRYLLTIEPPSRSASPEANEALARTRFNAAISATLPREQLIDLYRGRGMSLRDIATGAGMSRQAVTRLARDYGLEIRKPHLPQRTAVDRTWLHEQYLIKRRTLPDIARELGMSSTNLARWAKKYDIPLRSRGGSSHSAALAIESSTIHARQSKSCT